MSPSIEKFIVKKTFIDGTSSSKMKCMSTQGVENKANVLKTKTWWTHRWTDGLTA